MFIYELSAKFFSLFMSLVLFFNGISFNLPFGPEVEIDYSFSNSDELSAAGTVTLTASSDGEYELYWGDEDGKKLDMEVEGYTASFSEFASVEVENGTGSAEIQPFTAIPDGAETVLAYYKSNFRACEPLPEGKIHEAKEPDYRFGALSDLHFNRYFLSLTDDAMVAFPNALSFLEAFDVSLVAMSGDLSSSGETNAFEKFNYISSKFDFPVYTCTGNHDVNDEYIKEDWLRLVNSGVYGEEKREGVTDVNDLDFVYLPQGNDGDVFVFLCQSFWDYNHEDSRLLTDAQLDWLENVLDKYSEQRVYIFFHTFMANADGNDATGEGNILNDAGATYDLVFTQGCADEVRFRALLKEHKNVIYFNGHSHWAFDQQKYNPLLNVTDYDGEYCTMVHISSVSSPRRLASQDSESRNEYYMRSSEGYLVSVYGDKLVLQGVDFLRGEFLSYATYVINK